MLLNSSYLIPAEQFFNILKHQWLEQNARETEFAITEFFDMVKTELLKRWNDQIIAKSKNFHQSFSC